MIQYFKFEEDFVEENIRCIPMIARFKLDACGIKLKLKEWSCMNEEERKNISEYPCENEDEIKTYRKYVKTVILFRTSHEAQDMEVDKEPSWANLNVIPESVQQKMVALNFQLERVKWKQLNDLQRFVLVKLSRPSHENRNFPIAIKEFGLL
ncbi:MAG: nitrate reductase associated protein [Chitinophagaceae bacterium]|nr:nitrate reductase associated protein [Chitinophagaceae bacterium]